MRERYEAYKDSGIEWIGEIPEEWDTIPFSLATERLSTGLNPRNNFTLTKDDAFFYVTIKNFKNGELLLNDDCDRIDKQAWEVIQQRSNLAVGDILFASISSEPNAYIITSDPLDWNINESVFSIRVNKKYYDTNFFFYCITDEGFFNSLRAKATGATFVSIKQNMLNQSRLVLPDIMQQKTIVDYLDSATAKIDELVEDCEREVELLQEYRKAVISEAVTKGLDPNAPMKDSGIEWIGEIPEKWLSSSLSSVTSMITNGYVGPTRNLFVDEGVRYLQSLHIVNGQLDFEKHPYFVSKEWSNAHSRSCLLEGDVLVVQTGAIGSCAYVDHSYEGCNCHALIILRPDDETISGRFLYYYLLSDIGKEKMLLTRTGATHPHLNSTKIKFTSIVVPPIEEQNSIVVYLDTQTAEIDSLIEARQEMAEKLREYRKSLISEAVTGKFKVPGVE